MTTYRVYQRAEGLPRPVYRGEVRYKTVAEQNTGIVALLYGDRPGARVERNRRLRPCGTRIISVALWDRKNLRYNERVILIPVAKAGRDKKT